MPRMLGFSLLEFIITLAIAVILAVMAIPLFMDLYQEYQLKTAAQHLFYVLQHARSEAIKDNKTVYAVFQSGDNWCYGTNPNAACTCSIANHCTLSTESAPKPQVLSLSVTGMTGNSIQFEGTRGATYTTSTVTFTLYGKTTSLSVKINPLGNMKLCSSSFSEFPACT